MDALLRRRMMIAGGVSPAPLPYDAEVQYLQGDGSIHLYPGLFAAGNVQIKIRLVDFFTSDYLGKWPFGARDGSQNKGFGMYLNSADNKIHFIYASTADYILNSYSDYPSTCDVEIGNGTIKIGSTTHNYAVASFTGSKYITLFGLNNAGTPTDFNIKIGRVYMTNGTTTLDLIPCRKNGVGYMYDTISQSFLPKYGTGAFILGPDV